MNRISKPPEIRKQEILDEAKKQFLKNGYEGTSMTNIAAAIHVTEGLCYKYFKSKQELFQSVIDKYVEEAYEKFVAVVSDKSMSLEERINLNFKIIKNIETPNGINKYFHNEKNEALHLQIIYKIMNRLSEPFQKIIEEEAKKGTIHIDSSKDVAHFIMFGALGVLLCDDKEDKEERIKKYVFKMLGYSG
ncbi:TetR/AcrR family transcriptional regulator [Clostridium hydrogenum]|uniref:TetR/AcrR family transcriptional regulator n=1 Tax=Clostridium hydrogenum TaxID=2855764 RepID=UPI001F215B7C|nr:TetR/AcrR family transcriptional regulator [Clostridium hydrogenum]